MSSDPSIVKSHCNQCGQETKHDLLHRKQTQDSESIDGGRYEVSWSRTWLLLECRGCGDVSLLKRDWCSENDPFDPEEDTYYPPRVSRKRPEWTRQSDVPDEYDDLLNETYIALQADSRRLAMMGARALIDIFINRKVGDVGGFEQGLKAVCEKGYLSKTNREVIEAAIGMGHASAHRGHQPTVQQANAVIDIVENLIQSDVLSATAEKLKAATPPRKKAASAAKKKDTE